MKTSPQTSRTTLVVSQILILIGLMTCTAFAQDQSQYDHGTSPQQAPGVSAVGSYTSADLGTVNVSNGSLNFRLPLGSVGGRGFSLPITLNYNNKVWSASSSQSFDPDAPGGGQNYPVVFAVYDDPAAAMDIFQRVAPGWSIGGVPVLRVRGIGITPTHVGSCDQFSKALTKLTLILPDKGEVELRDDATDGEPLGTTQYNGGCYVNDGSRGQRWHATDGSGTIFISDANNGVVNGNLNGTVITGDGTRYRIVDTVTSGASVYLQEFGRTDLITDRNGNQMNIAYATDGSWVTYTDQLGRVTRIDFNEPDPDNTSQTLAVLVSFPGYPGTYGNSRYYKIKTGTMNQNYRSGINPTLPVINGDLDPMGYGYTQSGSHTSLFPDSYGSGKDRIDTKSVLTEIVLPDGRSLSFKYNEYGEVSEVIIPTGGKVQYDYAYTSTLPSGNSPGWETHAIHFGCDVDEIDRAVVARRTYADGSTLESSWTYSYSATIGTDGNGWPTATNGYTDVQARAADNSLLLNQRHVFMDGLRFLKSSGGTGYSYWSTGIERRTETRNASNAVITASEQDWTQRASVSWSSYPTQQIAKDNRIDESRTILDDGKVARVKTYYQSGVAYNNPSDIQEFDFDQTNWTRRTITTFADSSNLINSTNYAADSIRLLHLPLNVKTYEYPGNSENKKSESVYEYDVYSGDNHASLEACASVIQHDSSSGTSYTTRGNLTRAGTWLNVTSGFIYSYPRYDIVGNVVSTKDPNGNVTTISFADNFGAGSNPASGSGGTNGATFALPTLITSPPPQSGQAQQTALSQYDFNTGLLTGFRDRNSVITQTIFDDPFNRPTQVKAALGISGAESHTKIYYAPQTNPFSITLTKNDVLTAKDQSAVDDGVLRSWTKTDGFGRTIEAWTRDPLGDDKVVNNYDALGRAKQVSNPFRSGESAIYTTSVYDLAGRVTSITTPDSAVVSTSYSSNTVTVTDQNSKSRKSVMDGLGRLVQVYEDLSGLNYLTSYTYDTLDNLTGVSQVDPTNSYNQTRTFVYDSLKRLTSATNPESGTVCYGQVSSGVCQANGYDGNGNLIYKTDARGILTTYAYDALNRNITVNYSDTSTTPDISRYYDNTINYGKGRFWYDLYYKDDGTVDHQAVDGYDPYGRVWVKRQVFYSGTWYGYESRQTYDLAGHPKTLQYPSGHIVTYNYDTAGRLADDGSNLAFTGNLGDGTSRTYAQGVIYNPLGGMTKEQFGTTTALYNKLFYNSRGQLSEIRLSTSYTGASDTTWDRGAIINSYSAGCSGMCGGHNSTTSMTDNNGNLKTQEIKIPSSDTFLQTYAYDALNRLQSVSEAKNGGATSWQQQYLYDRYGNRTIDQTNTWGTGIPKPNFGVSTVTNRLTPPTGLMTFDNAGNLINDTFTGEGTRTYDGENRMTSAYANGQYQYYAYDADGHRARRKVNNVETWQVYGPNGELLAEYSPLAAAGSPRKEYGYRNGQLLVTAEPGDAVWIEDGLPTGASSCVCGINEAWGWVSSNPTPQSGSTADTTVVTSGLHQQFFDSATQTLTVNAGDSLVAYVYLDSANRPSELMLQFYESVNGWEHRAYWGSDNIAWGTNGTVSRRYMGALPSGGQWVRLEIPAGQVGLEGRTLTGFALTLYDGRASIDHVGKTSSVSGNPATQLRWLVTDQLGTPRMIFDQTGSLADMSRHDYLPFGEELFGGPPSAPGVNGRVTTQGYSTEAVRQKFTSYERDNELNLDYAKARYYSYSHGRFTGADPLVASGKAAIPQSWNRYSYVLNNPLKFIDPSGMMWVYHYLDKAHQQIGIAWIDGNRISNELKAQGYQALNFGGADSRDISLADGSVVRLRAYSARPQLLRQAAGSDEGGYVNSAFVQEFRRQTAPMPQATGLFVVAAVAGGISVSAASVAAPAMILPNAGAYVVTTAHEMGRSGEQSPAEVVAGTRAVERPAGQISESGFLDAAQKYLGPGYKELSPGRYVSADGMSQVRFGAHETRGPGLHGHFEAYDMPGGRVIENSTVKIVPK